MTLYDKIRNFWDLQPCGTTHLSILQGTREYFEEFDKYYENLYPYLLPFLDIESMKGKTVLEIGLGSGFTLQRIAKVAEKCYGLDISAKTIELNEKRKKYYKFECELLNASATSIPLPDNSVDIVVSIGCLHHIPDIQKAIDEIYRVLKPGGVFKGMVYNRNSYRFLVYRRIQKYWRKKDVQQFVSKKYDGEENPYGMVYSKTDVTRLFNKFSSVKFKVENFVGEELLPWIGNKIPRKIWLTTIGKILGLDLYFTAKAVK